MADENPRAKKSGDSVMLFFGREKMPFGTRNPYAAYQSTGIKTASQGSLVVMLYRGAVKELTAADACFGADGQIAAPLIEKNP